MVLLVPSFIIVLLVAAFAAVALVGKQALSARQRSGRGPLLFGKQEWKARLEMWAAYEDVNFKNIEGRVTVSKGQARATATDPHVALQQLHDMIGGQTDDVMWRIEAHKELGKPSI